MKTAASSDDDDERALTPRERELLRQYRQSVTPEDEARIRAAVDVAAAAFTSPAMETLRRNIETQIAPAMADFAASLSVVLQKQATAVQRAQEAVAAALAGIADLNTASLAEIARSISVAPRLDSLSLGSGGSGELTLPDLVGSPALDADFLDRVAEVYDSKQFDAAMLAEFAETVDSNPELAQTIDAAVDRVAKTRGISRARARKIVVFLVWLAGACALAGLSFVPLLGALPGAVGIDAPKLAKAAGDQFDKRFPPQSDSEDKDNEEAS